MRKFFILILFLFNAFINGAVTLNTAYKVENDWGAGYQITVTVSNPSSTATTNWYSQFNLPDSQERITSLWNGNYSVNGTLVTVTNPSWAGGGIIPANGSTTYGFVVSNANRQVRQLLNLKSVGNSNVPTPNDLTPTVLQPITNTPGSLIITLRWNSVPNATAYILERSSTSDFSSIMATYTYDRTGVTTMLSMPGPGTYYFRVKVKYGTAISQPSNIQSVTISTNTLSAPTLQPIANPSELMRFTLKWNAVANATSYVLEQSSTADFANKQERYFGSDTSFTLNVANPGKYYYRVRAFNATISSAWSNIVNTTATAPTQTLIAPILQSISNPDSAFQFQLVWNRVNNALNYIVEQANNVNFENSQVIYNGIATSIPINVQNPGTYYYRVKAVAGNNSSLWSNSVSTNVVQNPTLTAPVLQPIINTPGSLQLTINWSAVNGATNYVLEQSTTNTFSSTVEVYSGPLNSAIINVPNVGVYYFRVKAQSGTNNSPWSNIVNTTIAPSAPVLKPVIVTPGSYEFQINWDPIPNADSYIVEQSNNNAFTSTRIIYNGANTSIKVTVDSRDVYYYRAKSRSGAILSTWSNIVSAQYTANGTELVAPVLQPVVNNTGSYEFKLQWNTVANTVYYAVIQSLSPNFTNSSIIYTGNETSFNVYAINPGTYYYRIQVANGGLTMQSNTVSLTVTQQAPAPNLVAPTLEIIQDSQDAAVYNFKWSLVPKAVNYFVEKSNNSNFDNPQVIFAGPLTEYTFVFREPGIHYFRVRAHTATYYGPYSQVKSITISNQNQLINILKTISIHKQKNLIYKH